MRKRKYSYQAIALATALACALNGPLCAGAAGTVYAAETGKEEQTWKQDVGAGEAIAQENIIKLLSVEDLEALARQCSLDQWSVGKLVVLEADLDLTGIDFNGIPTFGGTFDGNGHTISGFSMHKSGDVNGFFRYVQEGAAVKDLNVSGEVVPDGHRDVTGGLVGNNKGTLSGCSFTGTVKGKNRTGGIAGTNEAQGRIYNCSFDGDVTGEHYAGGIVGENLGSVVRCKNNGAVNTTEVKVTTEISEFGLETLTQINSVSNMPAGTDIGGIAGASGGILQSCENAGEVGYPHTGYNVGGIVGRQSGYLDGCINKGTVNGRKDVGGIVGQFEPEVTLQFEPGMLADLYTELEVLQGLIDTTIQDAKGVSSAVSGSIQGLSDSTKNVKTATQGLSDSMIDWADENLEAINDFSARLSWAIDQMVPAVSAMSDSMQSMGDAAGLLSAALEDGADMLDSGTDALEGLRDAVDAAKRAAEEINDALSRLGDALGDDEKTEDMIHVLGESFVNMGNALARVGSLWERIAQSDEEKARAAAYRELGNALAELGNILKAAEVKDGSLVNADGLEEAADRVERAAKALQTSGGTAADGPGTEKNGSGMETLDVYAQVQNKMAELGNLLDEVSALFEEWETAKDDGQAAADAVKDALYQKLNLIREKGQDVSEALDELAGKETADNSLIEAVKEARGQLSGIIRTAEDLAEQLDSAAAGDEDGAVGESKDDGEAGDAPGSESGSEKEEISGNETGTGNTAGSESGEAGESEDSGDNKPGNEAGAESGTEAGSESGSGSSETGGSKGSSDNKPGNEGGAGSKTEAGSESGSGNGDAAGHEASGVYYARESLAESGQDGESENADWNEILQELKDLWKNAEDSMDKIYGSLLQTIEKVDGSLDSLIDAGQSGTKAAGTLSKASSKMKDSFRSLSTAASGIKNTLSGLAEQPAIQFTPLDSKITTQKDELDAALDDMTARIDLLNSTMTVSSDVMLEDMEAINRQFGAIIRVLKQSNEKEPENIEDRIVDISDEEEKEEQTDGCVTGSVNEGEICGDVNVAGIVGSMAIEYDFDPEDDLNKVGENSTDFSWLTSAVLSGCKNIGAVTAKKDCAGGVVGRMDMGKVSSCESYGAVKSSGGSYVGGIAGASDGAIRDSWAKCALSGTDYIGGIAGLGTTITNCHSLVEITESSAFAGAIAGKMKEGGELSDNTYVHTALAAVDGISYAGKAEPVAYDALLSDSSVPEKFKEFELTFTADGEVVSVMKFQYGKGIKSLPEIPAKEGYSAKWPDLDYSCLTFSQTVEAEYTAYESALSAGGEIPVLLVDGSFSNEAVIEEETQELTFEDEKGREHAGTAVTVRVKDPVLEEVSYTVHYKLPEEGKRYRLWVQTQDGWEKREYETDGDYLLLKNGGEEVTFLLEEYRIPWGIAIALAVAAALVLLVSVIRKRHRLKRPS